MDNFNIYNYAIDILKRYPTMRSASRYCLLMNKLKVIYVNKNNPNRSMELMRDNSLWEDYDLVPPKTVLNDNIFRLLFEFILPVDSYYAIKKMIFHSKTLYGFRPIPFEVSQKAVYTWMMDYHVLHVKGTELKNLAEELTAGQQLLPDEFSSKCEILECLKIELKALQILLSAQGVQMLMSRQEISNEAIKQKAELPMEIQTSQLIQKAKSNLETVLQESITIVEEAPVNIYSPNPKNEIQQQHQVMCRDVHQEEDRRSSSDAREDVRTCAFTSAQSSDIPSNSENNTVSNIHSQAEKRHVSLTQMAAMAFAISTCIWIKF